MPALSRSQRPQDTPANNKQMLGREQIDGSSAGCGTLTRLEVVSSSVAVSIPTGSVQFGRDSWANWCVPSGFERELLGMLAEFYRINVEEPRVHRHRHPLPDQHSYQTDADGDGDLLEFHEFVTGPAQRRPQPGKRQILPRI